MKITTTASHGFWTGQTVVIASSDIATAGNTPAVPTINRADWEIRVTGATTFVIVNDDGTDVILSSAGTTVGTVTPEGADLTAVRRFGVGVLEMLRLLPMLKLKIPLWIFVLMDFLFMKLQTMQ